LIRSGVRWAETMRLSCATPSAVKISDAGLSVGQSDWLPMISPTSGLAALGMLPGSRLGGQITAGKPASIGPKAGAERAHLPLVNPLVCFINELLKRS